MTTHFDTVGPVTRARLADDFASAMRRAISCAERAFSLGDMDAWAEHMNQAALFAHKADLLGG